MAADLDTLRYKARAARQLAVDIPDAGVRFDLLLPTRHESSVLLARASGDKGLQDRATHISWMRSMLMAAVTQWAGVKGCHAVPGASEDELLFDPAALELVLDAQPAWEQRLSSAMLDALAARRQAEKAAEKNS